MFQSLHVYGEVEEADMYTVLRMILGCVFLLIPLVFLKIFKVMKKNRTFILLFILSIIIMTASTFIPFENSILTFNLR